jgi:1,4-alpha-glucan branching enzyme
MAEDSPGGSPKLVASLAQNRPLDGSAGLRPDASRWWRGAAIYQVYVRSFCDSNGDGQGDFAGLTGKLDYIKSLSVDAIWLSPIHPSPNRDWGYDVADYDGVHPDYGTLDDFQALLEAAHARGLKIILDEVLCHTSDEHAWFAASRDGDAAGKDWYVWADPRDDGTVPNNWLSVFGGPAWSYQPARRQYYHHKFLRQQPKLNWMNNAAREAALDVLDLWLERGVDGFRLDVANAFLHDTRLTDNPAIATAARGPVECSGICMTQIWKRTEPCWMLSAAGSKASITVSCSENSRKSSSDPAVICHRRPACMPAIISPCWWPPMWPRSAPIWKRLRAFPITGPASPFPITT